MEDIIKQLIEEKIVTEGKEEDLKKHLTGLTAVTPERASEFLDSDDGKKLLQPRLDKHFTKGLETWKEKTLPAEIEKEIAKRFPAETEEQKEMRKLREDLEKEKAARVRESARNKAISAASQKGIPAELVEFAIGSDEQETLDKLEVLSSVWGKSLEVAVDGKIKKTGRDVTEPSGTPPDLDEQIRQAEAAGDWSKAISLKGQKLAKLKQST